MLAGSSGSGKLTLNTSGLMMNLKKSEGMWLGNTCTMPTDIDNNIRWTDKPVKCLGIYFGKDKQAVEELNWKPISFLVTSRGFLMPGKEGILHIMGKYVLSKYLDCHK